MYENNESPSQGLKQLSQTSKHTVEEDFLTLTPRTTIQGLKDCKEVRMTSKFLHEIFLFVIPVFISLFYIQRLALIYCLEPLSISWVRMTGGIRLVFATNLFIQIQRCSFARTVTSML